MLNKCANPVCDAQFRLLSEGRLFLFARVELGALCLTTESTFLEERREFEYFWLCSRCNKTFHLQRSGEAQVQLVPRQLPMKREPFPADEHGA
jgi:hypothetical protein